MIRVWSVVMFLLTVVPMGFVTVLLVRSSLRRFRESDPRCGRSSFWGFGVCIAFALFIGHNPHEDNFSGLDAAIYRLTCGALREGRGFHDVDKPFEQVPHEVKPLLLYRSVEATGVRQTRDRLFELTNYPHAETRPFFLPTLPMAAAGGGMLGLPRDRFVPLLGLLWAVSIFVILTGRKVKQSWVAGVSLLLGTAWPTWFLRGFHADAVGGVLVAMVILGIFEARQSWPWSLVWGLLLGLSISFHPTMVVVAIPVALCLVMKSGRFWDTVMLAFGGVVGLVPLLLINASVCQPYGDFLDFKALMAMCRAVPEIRMVVWGMAAVTACGVVVMTLAHVRKIRAWFESERVRKPLSIACAALCLLVWAVPFIVGGVLKKGMLDTWSGIGWYLVPVALGMVFLFLRRRPLIERFLLASICLVALVFIFIKGSEVPVGLWSQRRFCPVVFALISLLVVPLAEGLGGILKHRLKLGCGVCAIVLLPVALHLISGRAAYFDSNGERSDELVDQVEAMLRAAPANTLTLFDYYPHSVPFQWNLNRSVFGLNEFVANRLEHGPVMAWLAEEGKRRPVQVISSDARADWNHHQNAFLIEDGLWLTFSQLFATFVQSVATRSFLPTQSAEKWMAQTLYTAVPITESNRLYAVQQKTMDGSPLGLRPPWGRLVKGGMWSVEASGIVGTLPLPGERMSIEIAASWFPPDETWTNQVILLIPPFKGDPAVFTITDSRHSPSSLKAVIERAPDDVDDGSLTGVYRFHAMTPYNPARYGIHGFGEDLGAVIETVRIGTGE